MSKAANIREKLPYGAIKRISENLGVSYTTVNRVIAGKSKNVAVLKAIAREIAENKKHEEECQKLHEKLTA